MSDVGLFIINNCFDLKIDGNDLAVDDGLETAVAISLFTDRRITDEESEISGFEQKKGWWADPLSEVDNDQIGSKMWLLDRGKRTQQDLIRLQEYARQSLQWMIEDAVAIEINVTGQFLENQTVINVEIVKPNEDETRYSILWDAQQIRRL